jgi:chemotaxis protein methyltransferase CheR
VKTLRDEDFEAVRSYLLTTAGLVFDQSRRAGMSGVVVDRLRVTGAADVTSYLAMLDGEAGELERQRLLDGVTVQETQFFRNAPQMEALRRRVLPELLRRAAGRDRPLTIWSAGCSTGEEPYTLAMLMLELSPMLASQAQVRIVGTDVSAGALRAAGRATYTGRTLESAPPMVQDRWFEPRPNGALGVKDAAKELVELRLHNLVTEPPPFAPGEVDLIVCRNVTIYFNRATTAALVGSFHDVLAEGGYLLLGHSETLWQVSDAFSLVPVGDAFVYRKSHDSRRGSPTHRRRSVPVRSTPAVGPRPEPAPAVRTVLSPGARRAARATETGGAAHLAAAVGHLADGDYAAAALSAEAAVRADSLLAPAYVVLGRARCTLGQDAAAVDPLRKAVYLEPTAGDAHFLLAGALSRLGQHGNAAVSYRAAAASVHRLDDRTRNDLLGGRDLAELVDLCERLAESSTALAVGGVPAAAPGALT